MQYVAVAASVAGTYIQVAGAKAQAKGQARAARYNAAVNDRNAAAREIEADWRELVGDLDIQDYSDDFEELQAEVGARQRGNGWQMTGTAVDVMVRNARTDASNWRGASACSQWPVFGILANLEL